MEEQIQRAEQDAAASLVELGRTLHQAGEYEKSKINLEYAIQLNPENSEAYLGRGLCYSMLGIMDEAKSDLSLALEKGLEPDLARTAYLHRGATNHYLTDFEGAIKDLDLYILDDDGDRKSLAMALLFRADAKYVLGDLDGSLEDINRSIHYNRKFGESYAIRGRIKLNRKDYRGSCNDLSKAIEIEPTLATDPNTLGPLGFSHYHLSRKTEAMQYWSKAIDSSPGDMYRGGLHCYLGRGTLFEQLGDKEKALCDYQSFEKLLEQRIQLELESGKDLSRNRLRSRLRVSRAIHRLGIDQSEKIMGYNCIAQEREFNYSSEELDAI